MRNQRTSLSKALRLLSKFEPDEGAVSLSDLADRAALPKSTAHRLAADLIEWGALERHPDGLRLGYRLFELGQMTPHLRCLRAAALPYLAELYEATHETVHLAVRDGSELLFVEKLHAHRRSLAPSRVGGRMPLHASALGKALLAGSENQTVDEVLTDPLIPYTPWTLTKPQELCHQVRDATRAGCAFDRDETAVGLSCVAAPIAIDDDSPIGALSVAVPSRSRIRPERLAGHVKNAARETARAFANSGLGS